MDHAKGKQPEFTHVQSAIVVLRRGKADPRWLEAAEFLIERAAADTRLLLDAQELLRQHRQVQNSHEIPLSRWQRLLRWLAGTPWTPWIILALFSMAGLEALLLFRLMQCCPK